MVDLTSIPHEPGCYLYKDYSKTIIYVGKAKDLRKRVGSYFSKHNHDPKTQALVNNIHSVEYIVTSNEIEALVLENTLIKKHKPRYNIDLKDSKRYAYIQLTDEPFPRLLVARSRTGKGQYFGPFTSAQERDYIIKLLRNTFKVRTCKRLPKKPCLRYHINLCDAPCVGYTTKTEYNQNIKTIQQILKGKTDIILPELRQEMQEASQNQNFERALLLRDRINAVERLNDRQIMERTKSFNEDILNYVIADHTVYLVLFNIDKGTLINKQEFVFPYNPDFLNEFLLQYYTDNTVPKEIILPEAIDDTLYTYLNDKADHKLTITVPQHGEKRHLLNLVEKNIETIFFRQNSKMTALQSKLRLHELPAVIECFDISHLSGTSTVASMVQFRNAIPDKRNYRRFKIQSVEGVDDFKSMYEVVYRRYKRLRDENKEYPNLIVIDGGKGQLQSARKALEELNVKIPIISIAKRDEEIYVPGLSVPYKWDKKSTALKCIQEIRDEAHRFAITFNRQLRSKKLREDN